jgi:CheY-like chemotaxis protein
VRLRSEVASNGRQAIGVLRRNRYAAVLLDMMMPDVSGYEVISFLGTTADAVPVIICSAAVVKAIVRKPCDIDQPVAASLVQLP